MTKSVWKNEVDNLIALDKSGMNLSDIADIYHVSRQRMSQVFNKFDLEITSKHVKREAKRVAYHAKWGDRGQDLYDIKRSKWRLKKANALRAGIDFSIQFSEIDFPTHCPVLGIKLDYENESKKENSPSFDRKDKTKGYEVGNVGIISLRANRIKNDGSATEHRLIADYMEADDTITKQRSFNTVN
jgi:hypothetical protein